MLVAGWTMLPESISVPIRYLHEKCQNPRWGCYGYPLKQCLVHFLGCSSVAYRWTVAMTICIAQREPQNPVTLSIEPSAACRTIGIESQRQPYPFTTP